MCQPSAIATCIYSSAFLAVVRRNILTCRQPALQTAGCMHLHHQGKSWDQAQNAAFFRAAMQSTRRAPHLLLVAVAGVAAHMQNAPAAARVPRVSVCPPGWTLCALWQEKHLNRLPALRLRANEWITHVHTNQQMPRDSLPAISRYVKSYLPTTNVTTPLIWCRCSASSTGPLHRLLASERI